MWTTRTRILKYAAVSIVTTDIDASTLGVIAEINIRADNEAFEAAGVYKNSYSTRARQFLLIF
jgi:hypothetical protein